MSADEVEAKILADHKDLRGVLEALETHVDQSADSDDWATTLQGAFCGLVDLCTAHFGLEEETGVHLELRQESPHLASRLEKLLSDHGRILGALRTLTADLARPSGERDDVERLKARALEALEALREHERAESAIMMEAYWDDLGGESG